MHGKAGSVCAERPYRWRGTPSGNHHERNHQAAGRRDARRLGVAGRFAASRPAQGQPREGGAGLPGIGSEKQGRDPRDRRLLYLGCLQGRRQAGAGGRRGEIGKGRYGAVPGAQARIGDPARLSRMVLAFLASPRRIGEVVRHTGAPRGTVRSRVDALICTGQAARVSQGLYVATGRPRAVPGGPAAPQPAPCSGRLQPIRDAILAFLGEPRQAQDVAAHIGRPVSTATGHLAAMRRLGLVLRIAPGRYERAVVAGTAPDAHRDRGAVPVRGALAGAWAGSGHLEADALQEVLPAAPGGPTTACAGSVPPRRVA